MGPVLALTAAPPYFFAMDTSHDDVAPSPSPEPPEPSRSGHRSPLVAVRRAGAWARVRRENAAVRATQARLEHASVRIAFEAYERDSFHAGGLLAGGLAYRLFLWLLAFALTVSTAARLASSGTGRTPGDVARESGMSSALVNLVRQATDQSNQSAAVLFLLGLTLTLWTSMAVLKALRVTSALTWGIRPAPLVRPLPAAVTTSIMLAVLVLLNTVANLVFGNFGGLPVLVLVDAAVLVTVAMWSLLALPHPPDVTIRDVLPGALLFATGSLVLAVFSHVYLAGRIDRANDLYGALGLATVFLLWLFLLGRLIVSGFALNATIRQHRLTSSDGPSSN